MIVDDNYYWLGFVGGVFTTFSFLPQIFKTIQKQKVEGVSFYMYLIIAVGFLLWTIYGILLENWVIFVFNLIALAFAIVILILYSRHQKGKLV